MHFGRPRRLSMKMLDHRCWDHRAGMRRGARETGGGNTHQDSKSDSGRISSWESGKRALP